MFSDNKPEEAQEVKEVKKKSAKVEVKLATRRVYEYGGSRKNLVVSVDSPLRGFLVNEGEVSRDLQEVQRVDEKHLIEVYKWEQELQAMLPSIEAVREQVLRSFWASGAFSTEDLEDKHVVQRMFDQAFPHKL
jgi:hypothetical protein